MGRNKRQEKDVGTSMEETWAPKPPSWGSSLLEGLKTVGKAVGGMALFVLALPVAVLAVVTIAAVALSVVAGGTVGLLLAAVPFSALAAYKVASGKSDDEIADIAMKYLPEPPVSRQNDEYVY